MPPLSTALLIEKNFFGFFFFGGGGEWKQKNQNAMHKSETYEIKYEN